MVKVYILSCFCFGLCFLFFFEPSVCRPSSENNLKLVLLIVLFIPLKQLFVLALNSARAHDSLTLKLIGLSGAS